MSNHWRRVAAALADDERRAVYAQLVLGVPGVPGARREKAIAPLRGAGLIDDDGSVDGEVFARLLAEHPAETKQGVDRWLRDGRINQYPARPAQRLELLAWAAERVAAPGEVLTERQVNERLETLTTDAATLRRYLVDAALLERSPDGSAYRRT